MFGVFCYFSNSQIDNVGTFLKWETGIEIYCTDQQASGCAEGGRRGSGSLRENFHFYSLCQQPGTSPPDCFLEESLQEEFSRLPALRSAQCSKAEELDRLSFTKPSMKVSLKIQKESNFGSLRQRQEGPGGVPSAASARLGRSR